MIHDTENAQISQTQGYYHDGFVATHALGHVMYGYICKNIKKLIRNSDR